MSTITSVLLAEDHALTRLGMDLYLKSEMNVQVVEGFPTLPEAIAALRAKPFDLAVIDLGLPGLSSFDQLRSIRQGWPLMKVIVMSGSERSEDIIAALSAGVHGYIMKTVPLPDVGVLIKRVMNGEIYVPPRVAEVTSISAEPVERPLAEPSRAQLPPRQRDVLEAMSEGLTNQEIAKRLDIAIGTVKMHVTGLYQTLGVHKRAQAVIVGQKYLRKPKPTRRS